VPLELADDGQNRVWGERGPARRIEAVDRLDQRETRDLLKVLARLGGVAVARRQVSRKREVAFDQRRPQRRVAACSKLCEARLDRFIACSQVRDDRRGRLRGRSPKRVAGDA
jgi:hypothetical protein